MNDNKWIMIQFPTLQKVLSILLENEKCNMEDCYKLYNKKHQ